MKTAAAPPPPQPGDRLGVWRTEQPLGPRVASGQWWRVVNAQSQQPALMLVYADAQDAGAVLLRMAASEGQGFAHADIAWPLDSGVTPAGLPYVVMPLLAGQPLAAALAQASLRRRLEWVLQLCELLLLAREHGMALVELDPSLLWVGTQQQLRLHALALVRAQGEGQRLGSLQGLVCRAAQPLQSPEVRAGAPGSPGEESYRVGALLVWLVCGRWPDRGGSPAPGVEALAHWLSLRPEAREQLDALLRHVTAAAPAERPADLLALAQAVETWLDGGAQGSAAGALDALPSAAPAPAPAPAPAIPTAVVGATRAVPPSPSTSPAPAEPPAPPSQAARPAARHALGWAAALALVGLLAWLLLRTPGA